MRAPKPPLALVTHSLAVIVEAAVRDVTVLTAVTVEITVTVETNVTVVTAVTVETADCDSQL